MTMNDPDQHPDDEANQHPGYAGLPRFHRGPTYATFGMTSECWHVFADHMDQAGEKRIAGAIRHGIGRWKNRDRWRINLRFRDGSIPKIDAALNEVFPLFPKEDA